MAHLIDKRLVWICHKCKYKSCNRFNLCRSKRTFYSSPLCLSEKELKFSVHFKLESVLCKDGSFLPFRTLARLLISFLQFSVSLLIALLSLLPLKCQCLKSLRKRIFSFLGHSCFYPTHLSSSSVVCSSWDAFKDFLSSNASSSAIVLWGLILQIYSCVHAEFPVEQNWVMFISEGWGSSACKYWRNLK